jgi:hypothetical protein
MAFVGVGTASASIICSTTTNPCTSSWPTPTTVDFSLTSSAKLKEVGPEGETINTCTEGTVHGIMTQGTQNGSTSTPILHIEKEGLTWGKCNFPTTTVKGGTLEVHNIAGTFNGTVTGSGFEVTINTVFFGSCIYGTGESVDLGKLTEGNPAVFHAEAIVKRLNINFACPKEAEWNATYTLTSPSGTTGAVSPT